MRIAATILIPLLIIIAIISPLQSMIQTQLNHSLYAACGKQNDKEKVHQLLQEGAELNSFHQLFQDTPLHNAARFGNTDIIHVLIDAGAEVNKRDFNLGLTPLHSAVYMGNLAAVKALLERGADVHAPDNAGVTPIRVAALDNRIEIAKELFEHGTYMGRCYMSEEWKKIFKEYIDRNETPLKGSTNKN